MGSRDPGWLDAQGEGVPGSAWGKGATLSALLPLPPPLSGALAIHQPVALKISLLNESLI